MSRSDYRPNIRVFANCDALIVSIDRKIGLCARIGESGEWKAGGDRYGERHPSPLRSHSTRIAVMLGQFYLSVVAALSRLAPPRHCSTTHVYFEAQEKHLAPF